MTDENFGELFGTSDISVGGSLDSGLQPTQPGGLDLTTLAMSAQITGSFLSAIGAGFSTLSQKEQIKSQELNTAFASRMAAMDARQAEDDAQAITAAGRSEIGRLTLAAGQRKSQLRVSAAARGVVGNVGSAAEIQASEDLIKEMDVNTINSNTVRAAGQARVRATNSRNQSLLSGVSAGNLRRSASTIRPGLAFINSSIAGAGQFAATFTPRARNR